MSDNPDTQQQAEQAATTTEAAPPTGLLSDIADATGVSTSSASRPVIEKAISELLRRAVEPTRTIDRVDKGLVDSFIAEIDHKLSEQVNAILHDSQFQKMESAWRGLKYVVAQTNFRENIRIELLNVSKDDLITDFEDAPEVPKSGLYKLVYTDEYGVFGGKPLGAMIANYEFGPNAQDIGLLQKVASVGAMAHAPFIAAAGPQFFGADHYLGLPNMKDLEAHFEGPDYIKWNGFRETEDARYVGLTMPRFLLRQPYDPEDNPVKSFHFEEDVTNNHEHYLWGNTSFTFATRLTDSFSKYRWCPNIIGPQSGGAVENLPVHTFKSIDGDTEVKIPTEVLLSERKEFELAEQGFIGLTMRKGSDNAAFFSANTCQKAKNFPNTPEGKASQTNYKLGTQLPYLMIVNRLAHYIKVLQRENIGSWKERVDLERELNDWIRQYVADMDNPSPGVRGRRPLRQAEITVSSVEGDPGWYKVDMKVRPHFKYMGAFFTLSLVGKLDKE